MPDDVAEAAKAVMAAAKDIPDMEARLAALEARVKALESWAGHIHLVEVSGEKPFQKYPMAIGNEVVHSEAEEAKLRAALEAASKAA